MKIRLHPAKMSLVMLILSAMVMLSGCHASRSSTKKSSSNRPSKTELQAMIRDIDNKHFSIKEISKLIEEAQKWIGAPYSYGGHAKSGTDCSGMVMEVFREALGIGLPRDSRSQRQSCSGIDLKDALPGDLLFFATGSDRGRISHVGIYIGDNEMIHASTSRGVIVSRLNEKYYAGHFHSAGRHESISKIYSKKGKGKKSSKTEPTIQVVEPTVEPVMPDLDEIISSAVDSIFSSQFFD